MQVCAICSLDGRRTLNPLEVSSILTWRTRKETICCSFVLIRQEHLRLYLHFGCLAYDFKITRRYKMKTLSRAITARFFPNLDSYNALRRHWSGLINSEHKH